MTAAVTEEHLEPDPDALRSLSATAAEMVQYMEMDSSKEGVMVAAEELHRSFDAWDLEQRAERHVRGSGSHGTPKRWEFTGGSWQMMRKRRRGITV